MKYKTIEEFHKAVRIGEIDEKRLIIVIDNDCTMFLLNPTDDDPTETDIEVSESGGYQDVESLYSILFPEAEVSWC